MEAFAEKGLRLIALERDTETLESQAIVANQIECSNKLESQGICLSRLHVNLYFLHIYLLLYSYSILIL